MLKDLEFPKTRGFRLGAFFSGFFLGAELAGTAFSGGFVTALTKAIKTGVQVRWLARDD